MKAFKINHLGSVQLQLELDTSEEKHNIAEMQDMGGSMVLSPHGKLGVILACKSHDNY